MRAIEFETNIKKNTIEIPYEYKSVFSKHARVIVLVDEENELEVDKTTGLDFAEQFDSQSEILESQQALLVQMYADKPQQSINSSADFCRSFSETQGLDEIQNASDLLKVFK